MRNTGTRQPATALAIWYQLLPCSEQDRLNKALRDNPKAKGGDLRRNFRLGLANPNELKQGTVNLLRARYGMSFAHFDGGMMSTLDFFRVPQIAYA